MKEKDQKFKADIKGLPHMAGVVGEPVELPLPHVGRGPRTQPSGGWEEPGWGI